MLVMNKNRAISRIVSTPNEYRGSQMKLEDYMRDYRCDAETNNRIYREFTMLTELTDFLLDHRKFIESNRLGFGDRAFHYMWLLVLQYLSENFRKPRLLEIGVYKGQVLSLWSLISRMCNYNCELSCITPLSGNTSPQRRLDYYWKLIVSSKFRADVQSGNLYSDTDYRVTIRRLFEHFNLDFERITLHKGFSTDGAILDKLGDERFELIYIDGDHSRKVVEMDIHNFSSKISVGGLLVMDDASCNIPGGENGVYWKGHQSVSDGCEIIPRLGFVNVLNVGHNRIYQRMHQ